MPTRKALASALTFLILLSGCRVGLARRGTRPPPSPPASPYTYGSEFEIPPTSHREEVELESEPAVSEEGKGHLELTLRDGNDLNPPGIPIDMTGVITGRFHSDKNGRFNFSARPGRFGAKVPVGCIGPLMIEFGPTTGGVLVRGQTLKGRMSVGWQHSVRPANGAYPSKAPFWPVGDIIDVYYDVIDRCANDKARDAEFPTWNFRTSENLELAAAPVFRTNDKAQALVRLRCKASGDIELFLFDSLNPPDQFDVVRAMASSTGATMDDPRDRMSCA